MSEWEKVNIATFNSSSRIKEVFLTLLIVCFFKDIGLSVNIGIIIKYYFRPKKITKTH